MDNRGILVTHTADDEEPKCMRCDNYDVWDCENRCGWEKGWIGYKRTEILYD